MYSKLIDLSHEVDPKIPTWAGTCGFQSKITCDYPDQFRVMEYQMAAGCGTHLDVPAHIVEGGKDISTLDLQNTFRPAAMIDVTKKVKNESGYKISAADIEE